jgi:predicted N-acyltransferase
MQASIATMAPSSSHTISPSIDAVDLAAWERLCGDRDNPFMEAKFLRAVEQSMAGQAKVWYVVLRDDHIPDRARAARSGSPDRIPNRARAARSGSPDRIPDRAKAARSGSPDEDQPAACACLTEFTVDLAIVAGSGLKKIIGAIRRVFPRVFFFKIMMCGLPVSNGQSSLRIAPGVDRAWVLGQLDSMMREKAAGARARFLLFKEFTATECEEMKSVRELGYTLGESLPINMFERKFADFEQYLAALKAHYRQDIRRSKKKLEKAGLTITRIHGGPELEQMYTDEVHQLYLAVVERAESKLEVLPREFFLAMSREFGNSISFTYASREGRIAGFNWALRSGQAYRFMFCGIDYQLNEMADLYFNLMYAELDNGLRSNAAAIEVGQTADLFKSRLGCFPVPLAFYVKSTILPGLLRRTARFLFPARPPVPAYDIYKSAGEPGAGSGA